MIQRGPDGVGFTRRTSRHGMETVLLHSRLAILDLSTHADQPFVTDQGALVFNGEIYNYRELQATLRDSGIQIRSSGDTETLARLISAQGISALESCEGMWALAWFDTEEGSLFIARDRFGEKPLYVLRQEDGSVFFGSEPKFIFALRGRTSKINMRQVRRFLVNGYKSLYKSRETFFEGLEELPPGHFARMSSGSDYVEAPYWIPPYSQSPEDMTFDAAVSGTKALLTRSVELRLRSDVPLAFCLSGGIDSNVLVGIAKRELNQDVHGFTIVNTDARYEELDMVMATVNELKLDHTTIPVDTLDFLPRLRNLIKYHDAPVFTITYFAQWLLLEAIAEAGYKVSVSGTGADELFSGYFDHHNAYLAYLSATKSPQYTAALNDWQRDVAALVRNPYLGNPDYFVDNPFSRQHIYLDADYFSTFLVQPFIEPFSELVITGPLLRNRMANELLAESVPVILHEDDLNAMYFSVENRSPYLDSHLLDWSTLIPTEHLVQRGRAKAVLREAGRGLVPDQVLDNPRKVGFNAPIEDYLDLKSESVRSDLLSDSPIFDVVRKDRIAELLDSESLSNSRSKFLFNFISCKIFLEEFQ